MESMGMIGSFPGERIGMLTVGRDLLLRLANDPDLVLREVFVLHFLRHLRVHVLRHGAM